MLQPLTTADNRFFDLLGVLVARIVQVTEAGGALEFNEEAHPRLPKGDPHGGQWTKGVGIQNVETQKLYKNADGTYRADRAAMHAAIIAKAFEGKTPVENPVVHLMGGGPGSGKTTTMQSIDTSNAVMVAPDDIKTMLPEWTQRHGELNVAGLLHEESSDISKAIMKRAASGQYNIVIDGTGDSSLASLAQKLQGLRANGYVIDAQYVTVPINIALARAESRALKTGRIIAASVLRATHQSVSSIFPQAVAHGLYDTFKLWDNSGSQRVLIAAGTGSSLTIYNQVLWDAFLDKKTASMGVGDVDYDTDSADCYRGIFGSTSFEIGAGSGVDDFEIASGEGEQSDSSTRSSTGYSERMAPNGSGRGDTVRFGSKSSFGGEGSLTFDESKHPRDEKGQWTTTGSLKSYLSMVDKLFGRTRTGGSVEGFVLEHGRAFHKFASDEYLKGIQKRKLGLCYMNAYQLADSNPDLTYVEGFATVHGVPMGHAWTVTKDNLIVDPTWKGENADRNYYGVKFDLDYVRRTILARGKYGVLYNPEQGMPLFQGGKLAKNTFALALDLEKFRSTRGQLTSKLTGAAKFLEDFAIEMDILSSFNVQTMWTMLLNEYLGEVMRMARTVEDPIVLANHMQEFMDSLSDKPYELMADESTNVAYGEGRNAAILTSAETGESRFVIRSELLDHATCQNCEDIDGEAFEIDSDEYYANMPPADCEGGARCRGLYIIVPLADEPILSTKGEGS